MRYLSRRLKLCLSIFLILCFSSLDHVFADDVVLMSYGGHNETIGPYWVAADKGLYQKHGIDARLLQVRSAQISLSALISGEVPIFLPSIANVLSGVSAGAKLGCIAFPIKGVSRELVVRQDISSWQSCAARPSACKVSAAGFGCKP
jgi:ABC-type nitrate/sulfonate/bicarbonate transport system substrate-binding protein